MNFKRLLITAGAIFVFALLAGVLVDLNQYVMYPIPASLIAKWFVFGLIEFCVYGALATLLYPIKGNA